MATIMISPPAVQLYCARDAGPWPEVLSKLAALGIRDVEGYDPLYADPPATAQCLAAAGLTMPTGHMSLHRLEADPAGSVAVARVLGITTVFAPYVAEGDRPTDAAGWGTFGRRLATLGTRLAEDGIRLGWHNHDFEFLPLPDGSVPMAILLESAADLVWEADLAWIHRAGADPLEWLAAYGARVGAVHVKDVAGPGAPVEQEGWADLGEGVMDWPDLLRAARSAGVERFILEHDCPGDLHRFVTRSMAAFQRMTRDD